MRHNAAQHTLQDTLVQELQELLSLEKAFMTALPLIAQSACNLQLQREFERLHRQTREQIARLGRFVAPASSETSARPGVSTQVVAAPPVRDALLIASVRRIHHEKIAGYSTVQAWANTLNLPEVGQMVAQNLEEDKGNCEILRLIELESGNKA